MFGQTRIIWLCPHEHDGTKAHVEPRKQAVSLLATFRFSCCSTYLERQVNFRCEQPLFINMSKTAPPSGAPAVRRGAGGEAVDSAYIEIDGMSCGACVNAVKSALASLPEGSVVSAEVEVGSARLQFQADLVTPAKILEGAKGKSVNQPLCFSGGGLSLLLLT